jgi:hypothetical protein
MSEPWVQVALPIDVDAMSPWMKVTAPSEDRTGQPIITQSDHTGAEPPDGVSTDEEHGSNPAETTPNRGGRQ